MLEALLTVALLAGLPIVYLQGKRAGFERHHCVQVSGGSGPRPADIRPRAVSGLQAAGGVRAACQPVVPRRGADGQRDDRPD